MKFSPQLSLSQRLELKLQPRQILCNELLMLPLMDLEQALRSELEENIFLEAEERVDYGETNLQPQAEPVMTPPGGDFEPPNNGEEAAQDPGQLGEMLDYFKESKTSVSSVGGDLPEEFSLENRSLPTSWRLQLLEALRLERMSDEAMLAAEVMAVGLDERGFLTDKLEEVAAEAGVAVEFAEEALEILQRIAPPGVGARDLRERLLLMAQALQERNYILERILKEYYKELLESKFDIIRRKLNIDEDELKEAIELLHELYREAPAIEEGEPAAGVVPDAKVVLDEGMWKVILHDEAVPRLKLSSYAANLSRQGDNLKPEAKDYLNKAFSRAKWMMEALEQRRSTLRRILEAVVVKQRHFFDQGPAYMAPLRQEDIAEELQLHASTVSRAVQEKYITTPHGVFPLKTFFPRGVADNSGNQQARNSVQERLAALVKSEDPTNPLSDDELVLRLGREGLKLSRRTVCKYRDEMNIPPANKRKNLNRMNFPGKGSR